VHEYTAAYSLESAPLASYVMTAREATEDFGRYLHLVHEYRLVDLADRWSSQVDMTDTIACAGWLQASG